MLAVERWHQVILQLILASLRPNLATDYRRSAASAGAYLLATLLWCYPKRDVLTCNPRSQLVSAVGATTAYIFHNDYGV
jgi:hypothetical protein